MKKVMEEEDGENPDTKPRYDGEANEDADHCDVKNTRVWKDYVDYLKEVPTLPLRGPPECGLRE